ncbi:hypothetical protein P280DRAFT_183289 [Massarina eburnea CBS 473.64]|uniref:Mid2 domain-containing protein n=1 Tax=Massarina eburnea CBS 473.64 TaxID=1395130 RepID=A0A6A6SER8_9PLEO|nr:hypothetical protein P280DRAFT_183289 [Massarina eburnea CBS 473.64]
MAFETTSISRRATPNFPFDPTCPNNSKWYACGTQSASKFVGCCAIDPCGLSTGCTISNLQPVSFNGSLWGTPEFPPDPDCGGATDIKPYSCTSDDKQNTFWGCCKSIPCNGKAPSCPDGDFSAAFLKTDQQFAAYNETSVDSGTNGEAKDSGGSPVGVIVGAVVGGAVAIATIAAILIFLLCRRRKRSKKGSDSAENTTNTPGYADNKMEYRASALSDAPPTYQSPLQSPNPYDLSPATANPQNHKGYQQVAQAPIELSGESWTERVSELPVDSKATDSAMGPAEMPSPDPSQEGLAIQNPDNERKTHMSGTWGESSR